jgi:molybdopterin/thiamine biosynthesis adenylyltransferase
MMSEYWQMLTRQMPLLEREEQEKFKNATVTVIGCGGIGGETIEMLARMGVGSLIVADEDVFDITNLNRQALSTRSNIGKSKSQAAAERVAEINPHTNVTAYERHVDIDNADELIKNSRVVIDALDNVLTRVIISRKARDRKIPFVHGAIHGTMGQVTTFLANTVSYEEMFALPSLGKELTDDVVESLNSVASATPPAIGPAANLVSCIEAMEAFKIITGIGRVTVAPKILTFDLLDLNSFRMEEI